VFFFRDLTLLVGHEEGIQHDCREEYRLGKLNYNDDIWLKTVLCCIVYYNCAFQQAHLAESLSHIVITCCHWPVKLYKAHELVKMCTVRHKPKAVCCSGFAINVQLPTVRFDAVIVCTAVMCITAARQLLSCCFVVMHIF